ncbi:MAG: ABC transporter ATP-binding protein [Peptococcaceae bacterium]|nr:ABC transporter ATP-binding protein [Peptococcaceae bacterium]
MINESDAWLVRQVKLRVSRRAFFSARLVLASCIAIALSYSFPLLTRVLIDEGIGAGDAQKTAYITMIIFALTALGLSVEYVRAVWFARLAVSITSEARCEIAEMILGSSAGAKQPSGDGIVCILDDANVFAGFLSNVAFQGLTLVLGATIAMALMLSWSPLLLGIALLAHVAVHLTSSHFIPLATSAQQKLRSSHADMIDPIHRALGDTTTAQGLGLLKYYLRVIAERVNYNAEVGVECSEILARYSHAVGAIRSLPGILTIGIGGYLVTIGTMSLGSLMAFNILVMRLVEPAEAIARIRTELCRLRVSSERLIPLFRARSNNAMETSGGVMRLSGWQCERGTLRLRDVSIEFTEGEKILIVGNNGAGKTTLLLTLAGLLPNDTCGHEERPAIYLPAQGALLLEGTIKEGFTSVAEDWDVCRSILARCGILDIIDEIKTHQYQELSDGQRKLVAIALVLIQAERLSIRYLLLDELEAHLDEATVERVNDVFARIPCTVVRARHVLGTDSKTFDKIYEVGGGMVQRMHASIEK